MPAALRAVRATVVVPPMLALTFEVLHNEQMALFAVFGSFGSLVLTTFGGFRRDEAVAHLGVAVGGSVASPMQLRDAAEELGVPHQLAYGWVSDGMVPSQNSRRGNDVRGSDVPALADRRIARAHCVDSITSAHRPL